MSRKIVSLVHRAVLSLKGNDTVALLQGILTNDIRKLEEKNILYSLLLNNKGRIVEDLIIFKKADEFLVECDAKGKEAMEKLLKRYVMHKKVAIEQSQSKVYFTDQVGADAAADPRVPSFGGRIISESSPEGESKDVSFYHSKRFEFGIPEGIAEMHDGLPLFRNADFMSGISGNKGCYIGQETSATALNAGRVRQRTMPFTCGGIVSGKVQKEDGEAIGNILACDGRHGLASVKLTSLTFPMELKAAEGPLTVFIPHWWPTNPIRPYRTE